MTVEDRIIALVKRKPGLTEREIARTLFKGEGYQQRVNSTCRRLISEGVLVRRGNGGPGDPFTYEIAKR